LNYYSPSGYVADQSGSASLTITPAPLDADVHRRCEVALYADANPSLTGR